MNALIERQDDPITANLMHRAAHVLLLRMMRREKAPAADFDLEFFIEVIQEFVRDHDALRKSLDGSGEEEWLPDNF
jgi:hypothetical protein